jgi:hypothetical protein
MSYKTVKDAGADQRTPSVPQYFSWINNTNEGSTERHTLINLDFFDWLKRTYGMEIKIYAWDAGNFDGAGQGYGDPDGPKFRAQYPNGYDPVVKRAAELGIRMGLWGSPDGYGNTPEEEERRYSFMVDLCRKHHFALFKVDGVCGTLRPEKAALYARQLKECREYSPDLIVLNHRLDLYEAEKHVTTFLWQGVETYVDVHSFNRETCMHHRGFIFDRGLPDGLERLAEDHGVCISSSVAYFEDSLIYQAFGRCMILAPEIYGNPWLMRDDEYPKLARIYNLHKAFAPILVDGLPLPERYGHTPVSRGTGSHRFLTTGNNSWTPRKVKVRLNEEIGLDPASFPAHGEADGEIALIQRHPTEALLGIYRYGNEAEVTLMPFRACLLEVAALNEAAPVLENCAYETIREDADGTPVEVRMLCCEGGEIPLLKSGVRIPFGTFAKTDIREAAPLLLGHLHPCALPAEEAERLYEAAQFAVDNDSLESRELRRAGATAIPEVQAARDAFFGQDTYRYRGCDANTLFDQNPDTFFDGHSKTFRGFDGREQRVEGGCLRVDLGSVMEADEVEITCFAIHTPMDEVSAQQYTEKGSYSPDLKNWRDTDSAKIEILQKNCAMPVVKNSIHNIVMAEGDRVRVRYGLNGHPIRYFRLPAPMDRIYSFRLLKDGREVTLPSPKASNLQAPYGAKKPYAMQEVTVTLPEALRDGDYIAVALNGVHGEEGAYCVAELDGETVGFPDRAPAYRSNVWEFVVARSDRNYTYYLPLQSSAAGKEITVKVLLCDREHTDLSCDVWPCPRH